MCYSQALGEKVYHSSVIFFFSPQSILVRNIANPSHMNFTNKLPSYYSAAVLLLEGIEFLIDADQEMILLAVLLYISNHLRCGLSHGRTLHIALHPKLLHQLLSCLQIRHGRASHETPNTTLTQPRPRHHTFGV